MNIRRAGQLVAVLCGLVVISACGPKRPVFYPNDHLNAVGNAQAQADADRCMAEAKEYGAKNDAGKQVGGKAVKGAAVGAAISAVVSAVLGGNVDFQFTSFVFVSLALLVWRGAGPLSVDYLVYSDAEKAAATR